MINSHFILCLLGMIDVEELIKAFKDLGVEVDRTEAMKLLQRYFHMFRYISFSVHMFAVAVA